MLTLNASGVASYLPDDDLPRPVSRVALSAQDWVTGTTFPVLYTVVNPRLPYHTPIPILDRRVAINSQSLLSPINALTLQAVVTPPPGQRGNGHSGGAQGNGGNHNHDQQRSNFANRVSAAAQQDVQQGLINNLLPSKPINPFAQRDWPNPLPKRPYTQDFITAFFNGLPTTNTKPNAQYDWPVPQQKRPYTQDHYTQQFLGLPPAGNKPFLQTDWPNPVIVRLPTLTWTQSPRVQVTAVPTAQYDWPNPQPPRYSVRDFTIQAQTLGIPVVEVVQTYALVFMHQRHEVFAAGAIRNAPIVLQTQMHDPTDELVFVQPPK